MSGSGRSAGCSSANIAATYRFVRRYCERQVPGPLALRQIDPLIRQLTLYRDLIDRETAKEIPE